jgi:hypothetical protein
MGRLGGILADTKEQRGLRALKKVVDLGGTIARSGQYMAAAMSEFLKATDDTAGVPAELHQRLVESFERIASEEAKKVQSGLTRLQAQATSHDPDDIGAYPRMMAGFPRDLLAQAASRDPLSDEPLRLAERCNAIFRAIEATARLALSGDHKTTDLWATGGT